MTRAAKLSSNAGIPLKYANRHGLITGPTGTGKTVSIMTLVEQFSSAGVPVFAPDVKGDLTALSRSCPARLLDPFNGLRVPLWRFGPVLLSRALGLTDAQAGCLEVAFAYADETGAPLDTLDDMRAILGTMSATPEAVAHLGHVTRASVGTIQRAFLKLSGEGAGEFFGESAFDLANLLQPSAVTLLRADRLLRSPGLYGAFLLYLLRELAERMPETGDLDRPRLVFVFDEAHTIFADAPPALLRALEATARLIRSKGVGIYFASQSPEDVPRVIRDQCATRIEHSRDLGVGRATFSTLDDRGNPTAPRVVRPALPHCPLQPAAMAPERSEGPQGGAEGPDMTFLGHVFLAGFALAFCAAIAGAVHIVSAGKVGAAVAILVGGWLALRNRV